jgi:hypothetical protein
MNKSLELILDGIVKKVEKSNIKSNKKQRYLKDISVLKESYRDIIISEDNRQIYDGLIRKGRELAKQNGVNDRKQIELFLKYCSAALFDFKGSIKPLTRFIRVYLLTCMLFFALSPMYFQILPLLFIIPIFLGLKGVKKRTLNGLILSMTVLPMAFLTSVVWIKNAFLASKNFAEYINSAAQSMSQSFEFARNLTAVFTLLSIVMLVTAVYSLLIAIKYRKMFV